MAKTKVGIIGCGAIGFVLAKAITTQFKNEAQLTALFDHHPEKARALKKRLKIRPSFVRIDTLIRKSDLIIEAASAKISDRVAKAALKKNRHVLILSVGGLLNLNLKKEIRFSKGKLWIPSGAIAGIDGLLSSREAGLKSVRIITRKPPKGLKGAPYFDNRKFPALRGKKEICLFKGTAKQAIKDFPKNVNVSAILSLAGLGARKTQVEIWTSRTYRRNVHEITIESKAGKIQTVTENKAFAENPKTSALAAYSAIATLRRVFSHLQVGT